MNPVYHRENSGSGFFVSQLSEGYEIVWKPLTIGEWIEYDNLIKSEVYPFAYIENEIFLKCIQDKTLNINDLPAGIVSAVVQGILLYSGPQTIDELNRHLDINRGISNEIMHMLVSYVCQAFPAYKPEDVYALDYPTLMLRVAQAENKLLRTGAVSEPLTFKSHSELQQPETPQPPPSTKLDSRQLFDTYEQQRKKPSATKQTIISTQDVQEHNLVYTGHEKEDKAILQHQMEKDTALIYQDYLQQGKDGKITIKTPEERKAEYLAKIKIVKEKQEKLAKIQQEKLEKAQEQAQKTKKAKRDPGKRRK